MKAIATRSMHRAFDRFEERMMRAVMPRTDAADPKVAVANTRRSERTLTVKALTYKIAEVR